MRNSLESIKAGDYVAVHGGASWARDITKQQVTHTTPARVFIGSTAYTRSRGHAVGGSKWSTERIEAWDESTHAAIVAEQARAKKLARTHRRLTNFDWRALNQEQADAVLSLIGENIA